MGNDFQIVFLERMNKIIRIVSPAKAIEANYIDGAKDFLEQKGFTVELGNNVAGQYHYFSGTDEERRQDFQDAINSENVDIILCARGGYGTIRIVDLVDFSPLKKYPKQIIGFSDITVFHHHIHQHVGIETVHATMPLNFKHNTNESLGTLVNSITGLPNQYNIPSNQNNISGTAKGQVIGGNLTMICTLIGTNSDIDFSGKILFIEEVAEYIYAIDRMLWSLEKSGKLSQINGLIVGGMTGIKDTEIRFGKNVEHLILDRVSKYDYPVCFDFPAGHIDDNRSLVFGRESELIVEKEFVQLTN